MRPSTAIGLRDSVVIAGREGREGGLAGILQEGARWWQLWYASRESVWSRSLYARQTVLRRTEIEH